MFKNLFIICYYLLPSLAITLAAAGHAEVLIHRTPDDGLQPRLEARAAFRHFATLRSWECKLRRNFPW